jgi:hypothetical protein
MLLLQRLVLLRYGVLVVLPGLSRGRQLLERLLQRPDLAML